MHSVFLMKTLTVINEENSIVRNIKRMRDQNYDYVFKEEKGLRYLCMLTFQVRKQQLANTIM